MGDHDAIWRHWVGKGKQHGTYLSPFLRSHAPLLLQILLVPHEGYTDVWRSVLGHAIKPVRYVQERGSVCHVVHQDGSLHRDTLLKMGRYYMRHYWDMLVK